MIEALVAQSVQQLELVAQAHDQARIARRVEIDLRAHCRVGDIDVGLREERRLRRRRIRRMAARAVLGEQRIDRHRECAGTRRERLAGADVVKRGRLQVHAAAAAERRAGPVADPDGQLVRAGRVGREPAVVAAADLRDHHRRAGIPEVDDAIGRFVCQVDVVIAREARHLAAGAVAGAAAIGGLQVVPDIQLEGLHVLARGRRTRVSRRRRRGDDGVLLGGRAAAAAGDEPDERQRQHAQEAGQRHCVCFAHGPHGPMQ